MLMRSRWGAKRDPCDELTRVVGCAGVEVVSYQDSPDARAELFRFYEQCYPGKEYFLDDSRFEWQVLGDSRHRTIRFGLLCC